jgi:hypothetical protein
MKTFELYGDVYPEDSKYSRLMAQYIMTPNYDSDSKKEWELYRDFAVKKRMGDNEMKAFLVAKDSSHHNMILGRPPRDSRDLEQVYSRQFGKSASSREDEKELTEIFRLLQRRFGQARRWHESGFEDQYFHIDNGIMFFAYTTGLRGEDADNSDLEGGIRRDNKDDVQQFLERKGYEFILECANAYCDTLMLTLKGKEWMKNNRPRYAKQAEDECSGMTNTMDYVHCRAKKMEKENGTSADKAFPTAWSIACKYKRDQLSDADEHCQKKPNEYFKSKKANGEPMKKKAARVPQILIETIMPALYQWRVDKLSRDLRSDLKELAIGDMMEELVVKDHYDELFALKDNSEAMAWIGVDSKTYKKAIMQTLIAARQMKLGSSELELMAGHTPESFKKMMKDNPELAEEWEKQIKENEGVVEKKSSEADIVANLVEKWAGCEKLPNEKMQQMCEDKKEESKKEDKEDGEDKKDKKAHDKTARLMKRQIKILETYLRTQTSIPMFFEALPPKIQQALQRVKYQETLEMDVERWLSDYRLEQQINQNRWASNGSTKENPMNKEAKTALRTLTASWGLTADETYEMLAEDELGEYLAEMEAEMWAEEMEAGASKNPANAGFKKYQIQKKPSEPYYREKWWKPNTSNEDKGGNGAGGTANFNRNYHEYGEKANVSEKEYQKSYYQKRFVENKPIKRKTCPKFHGRKGPCDESVSKAK